MPTKVQVSKSTASSSKPGLLILMVGVRLTSGTAKRLRGETTRAEELPFYHRVTSIMCKRCPRSVTEVSEVSGKHTLKTCKRVSPYSELDVFLKEVLVQSFLNRVVLSLVIFSYHRKRRARHFQCEDNDVGSIYV